MTKTLTRRAWLAGVSMIAAGTMALGATAAAANDPVTVGALRFTSHAAGFVAFEKG